MFRRKSSSAANSSSPGNVSPAPSGGSNTLLGGLSLFARRSSSNVSDRNSIASSRSDSTSVNAASTRGGAADAFDLQAFNMSDVLQAPTKRTKATISLTILDHGDLRSVIPKKMAKINKLDKQNKMAPIHYAALYGTFDEFHVLLESTNDAVDINLKDGLERTALIYIAIAKRFDLLEALMKSKQKLNVDAVDKFGYSCFHYSIANEDSTTLCSLLYLNPNMEIEYKGDNYLHFAIRLGKEEAALDLLEQPITVNAADASERTPLHLACEQQMDQLCRALIEHDADPMRLDKDGKLPIDYVNDNTELHEFMSLKTVTAEASRVIVKRTGFGAPPAEARQKSPEKKVDVVAVEQAVELTSPSKQAADSPGEFNYGDLMDQVSEDSSAKDQKSAQSSKAGSSADLDNMLNELGLGEEAAEGSTDNEGPASNVSQGEGEGPSVSKYLPQVLRKGVKDAEGSLEDISEDIISIEEDLPLQTGDDRSAVSDSKSKDESRIGFNIQAQQAAAPSPPVTDLLGSNPAGNNNATSPLFRSPLFIKPQETSVPTATNVQTAPEPPEDTISDPDEAKDDSPQNDYKSDEDYDDDSFDIDDLLNSDNKPSAPNGLPLPLSLVTPPNQDMTSEPVPRDVSNEQEKVIINDFEESSELATSIALDESSQNDDKQLGSPEVVMTLKSEPDRLEDAGPVMPKVVEPAQTNEPKPLSEVKKSNEGPRDKRVSFSDPISSRVTWEELSAHTSECQDEIQVNEKLANSAFSGAHISDGMFFTPNPVMPVATGTTVEPQKLAHEESTSNDVTEDDFSDILDELGDIEGGDEEQEEEFIPPPPPPGPPPSQLPKLVVTKELHDKANLASPASSISEYKTPATSSKVSVDTSLQPEPEKRLSMTPISPAETLAEPESAIERSKMLAFSEQRTPREAELEREVAALKESVKQFESATRSGTALAKVKYDLQEMTANYETAKIKERRLQDEIDRLNVRLKDKNNQIGELEVKVQRLKGDMEIQGRKQAATIEELEMRIEAEQTEKRSLEKRFNACEAEYRDEMHKMREVLRSNQAILESRNHRVQLLTVQLEKAASTSVSPMQDTSEAAEGLDMSQLNQMLISASEEKKALRKQLESMQDQQTSAEAEVQKEVATLKKDLASSQLQAKQLQAQVTKLEQQERLLTSRLAQGDGDTNDMQKAMDTMDQKVRDLRRELAQKTELAESAERELSRVRDESAFHQSQGGSELRTALEQVDRLQAQLLSYKNEVAALNAKLKVLEQERQQLQQEKSHAEEESKDSALQVARLNKSIERLNSELNDQLAQFKATAEKEREARSILTKVKQENEELQRVKDGLELTVGSVQTQFEAVKKECGRLNALTAEQDDQMAAARSEKRKLDDALADARMKAASQQKVIDGLKQQQEKDEAQIDDYERQMRASRKAEESSQRELQELRKEHAALAKELEGLEQHREEVTQELFSLKNERNKLSMSNANLRADLSAESEKAQLLEETVRRLQEVERSLRESSLSDSNTSQAFVDKLRLEKDILSSREANSKLQAKIDELQDEILSLKSKQSDLQRELQGVQEREDTAIAEARRLTNCLRSKEDDLLALESRLDKARESLDEEQEQVKKLLHEVKQLNLSLSSKEKQDAVLQRKLADSEAKLEDMREVLARATTDQHRKKREQNQETSQSIAATVIEQQQQHATIQHYVQQLKAEQIKVAHLEAQVESLRLKLHFKDELASEASEREGELKSTIQKLRSQATELEKNLFDIQHRNITRAHELERENIDLQRSLAQYAKQVQDLAERVASSAARAPALLAQPQPVQAAPTEPKLQYPPPHLAQQTLQARHEANQRELLEKISYLEEKMRYLQTSSRPAGTNRAASVRFTAPPNRERLYPSMATLRSTAPPPQPASRSAYQDIQSTICRLKEQNMALEAKINTMSRRTHAV